jgi:hypothetical protein
MTIDDACAARAYVRHGSKPRLSLTLVPRPVREDAKGYRRGHKDPCSAPDYAAACLTMTVNVRMA